MRIYPVILCGGSGTRLWPSSRPGRPKQFLSLLGGPSLFQSTVLRLRSLADGRPPIVVTGADHRLIVERQLAELGSLGVVMVEPEGRDSAPAIAAAARWIFEQDPDGVAAVVASDHHIPEAGSFCASVALAAQAAAEGHIVSFGVRPNAPLTAYGYIRPGEPLTGGAGLFALAQFVEKPDAATAQRYVAEGYLWNSGNFVFGVKRFLDELDLYAPEIATATAKAVAEAARTASGSLVLGESFRAAPKISVDYAIMEKTAHAAVEPVDFEWSDLGAWDAIWAASRRDADGHGLQGDAILIDSRDCLVRAEGGPLVVGVGLKNIAVIAEADAVLICDLASAQAIKGVVDQLKAARRPETSQAVKAKPSLSEMRRRLRSWLFASALPLWCTVGADYERGGFQEALDEMALPVQAPRRARVQARQIYSFAMAGSLGWAGPWRQAVEHGLDYFIKRYQRKDGLFRTLVALDGAPADDTAMLYDQAFALLALASAAEALPARREELTHAGRGLLSTLSASRRAKCGGFLESGGPTAYQSNPHMHLLEASLAWAQLDADSLWTELQDEVVELALHRFIDGETGALGEFFDEDWRPSSGPEARIVEPGHQFEWCWLLERWGLSRGHATARAAARQLFQIGTRGIDRARNAAVGALSRDGLRVEDPKARLWPQTERLKAALILRDDANGESRLEFDAETLSAAEGLWRFFENRTAGLWGDKLDIEDHFIPEPAPASSLYHIVCAVAELSGRVAAD